MKPAMILGSGLLLATLAAEEAGREDALMKEWFAIVNRILDSYEQAPHNPVARKERERLDARGQQLRKTFNTWPASKQVSMLSQYLPQRQAIDKRMFAILSGGK